MKQEAPDPAELADLVSRARYKRGFTFRLDDVDRGQGSSGLTLIINRSGPDAYNPDAHVSVDHYFIVPAAAYNRRSWQRWLFARILLVEQHEAAEFFRLADDPRLVDGGSRPYAPLHGFGEDPYLITELATDVQRRTSFRNELNPAAP